MKKSLLILSLMTSHLSFSQTSDPGVTSTASASGDHAFVGTYSNSTFSNWLDTGDSATNYNLIGYSQKYAGFGVANGSNIVSPIIWMYANDKNAFRVRTMNYNGDMTTGTDLFTVRADGNVGIGVTSPQLRLHIKDPAGGAAYGIERGGKLWRWDIQNTGDKIWFGNSDAPNLYEYGNQGTFQVSAEYSTFEKARVYVRGNGTRHDGITPNLISGGLVSGNTDNAKFGKFNVALESWYGIGFRSSFNNKEGIVFNTRTASAFFEGNVGVGTEDTKGFKLGVNGKIAATEVKVATYANWADFVFKSDYDLPTLKEVEQHIKENGYLKDIPNADEVKKEGFYLAEMNAKLLQKIEELTLYTINQQKEIEAQNNEIKALKVLKEQHKDLQERFNRLEVLVLKMTGER